MEERVETKRFRIATWNMDHWKRSIKQRQDAWMFLNSGEIADVALLQECVPPTDLSKSHHVYREIGGSRPWGTAVASFDEAVELSEIGTVRSRYSPHKFSMLGTYPGSILVTRVLLPDVGPITCISIYGLINVYSQTTMLRIVADLIPLFDSPDGQRVILGGDFNLTTASKPDEPVFQRYKAALQAVESLGLLNLAETAKQKAPSIEGCLCGQSECFHLKTYGEYPGTQLDWLYATPELARRCQSIRVERDKTGEWSDHSPVIAEFEIPFGDVNRQWEPESFVKEIDTRYGADAHYVASELMAWALRKHEELSRSYQSASFNRLPMTSGSDPEMWFQLDLKYPESLQYTFSIKAGNGNIVIQFQYMSSPFDSEDEKESLWQAINEIPNIGLQRNLTGRPKIPLTALATTEAVFQFTAVFDQMIDRTIESHLKTREI